MLRKSLPNVLIAALALFAFLACSQNETEQNGSRAQQIPANVEKIFLNVEGMTCSGCEYNVESAIEKLAGVTSVKADYDNASAEVEYDPERASIELMVEALDGAGYTASQPTLN